MTISSATSENGKVLTITVQGRFDFSALQSFRNSYESLETPAERYIIDLKDSEYLDSSALGMLLALRDYAGGDAADIKLLTANRMFERF